MMTPSRYHCYLSALVGYFVFGALHEFTHLSCAYFMGLLEDTDAISGPVAWYKIIFSILFLRRVSLDVVATTDEDMDTMASVESKIALIRHVGWFSSVLLAILSHIYHHRSNSRVSTSSSCQLWSWFVFAGYITAYDAICTDLLRMNPIKPFWCANLYSWSDERVNDGDVIHLNFYCGNFGIILLHGAWLDKDGGKLALDILEKMVEGKKRSDVIDFEPICRQHFD